MDNEREREVTGRERDESFDLSVEEDMRLSILYEEGLVVLAPEDEAILVSRMTYREYLASPAWRRVREVVLGRDNVRCRDCGTEATEVHHIAYPRIRGDENIDNLVSVCRRCHIMRHRADKECWIAELKEKNPELARSLNIEI